jgi:PAS domain S-box-containing protein
MKDASEDRILLDLLKSTDNQVLLDNIRTVYDKFQDKLSQLSVLREMGNILLNINDFQKICQVIMDITITNTVARNCSIMLMDFDVNKLFLVAASNPDGRSYIIDPPRLFSREGLHYTFSHGEGVAGQALEKKEPILVDDVSCSPLFQKVHESAVEIGTLLSVPLIIEDTACGVFTLSHPEKHTFRPNDVNLFVIVSNIVALAINSALSYGTLKNSEEKYRALTENSNDGITIIEGDRHVYVNPAYRKLTGLSLREIMAIPFSTIFSPAWNNSGLNCMALMECSPSGTFEGALKTGSGSTVAVEISYSSFIHRGRPARVISLRDLTERKELEHKLLQAQKMEALGVIAGGVAHDLNNILSGITSYPDLLLMDLPENSPMRKPILTIKKSGEKIVATVQDLLALARRGAASMEVVNVNRLIDEYLESPEHRKIRVNHPAVAIRKNTNNENGNLNVLGSPYHLSKMLLNLVLNAAEAMPDGGGIVISTESRHLDRPMNAYETIPTGDYVVVSVTDTGEGIPADAMSRLFEPFFTKKKFGRSGTGLGLPVVWGTLKDHGGFVDVQSVPCKGTTFSLYLPVTRQESSRVKDRLPMEDLRGNGEKILVVDDIPEQREIATMILVKLGYEVASAASGEEAITYLEGHDADLVILDMIMDPGIDGLETFKRILRTRPGQKALITSGFSETHRVKEAQELGVSAYIRKPYFLEKIGIAVREALGR